MLNFTLNSGLRRCFLIAWAEVIKMVSRRIGKILAELEEDLVEAGLSEEQAASIVDDLEDALDDLGVEETESPESSDSDNQDETDQN